ncbi:MAG: phosphatidyl-myo-inositol alpha-mannosyltransferase [Solirubrobacterales bacterium]|nr:phosphatidyl-myo-inositol alpha-mannosyltransferase [Solirubrobacterales bacterium]
MSRALHRAEPELDELPEYVVGLSRTKAFGANGSISNIGIFPEGVTKMRRELRAFDPDVVHVHEPPAGPLSWDVCTYDGAPVVATFHAYSTKPVLNHVASLAGARRRFNHLAGRIAVSEAAAWTGRRWFGGTYDVIPNGVDVAAPPASPKPPADQLRLVFVGRPEERKGLPVLLTAFEALVEHEDAHLTVIGADSAEVARYVAEPEAERRIEALGRVSGDELWRRLHEADLLCAPSLTGESFGMILTEAFAAGSPVLASNIAGYADVVTDGHDGILVPPADPQRLAEELQSLSRSPERLERMGEAARESAQRYAWPRVAGAVEKVYERAVAVPEPATPGARFKRTLGLTTADGFARVPARRIPSLDPDPATAHDRHRTARRIGLGVAGAIGLGLTFIAAQRIGIDRVVTSIVRSDATWVLVATALMVASMFLRASSWYAIAKAALPRRPLRRRDVASATMVGVLMSATLPARLGEPARAMVLARRTGRMRETFPVLLGTLVSQSVLNIVALVLLGGIIVSSTDLFHSSSERLFVFSFAPLLLLVAVVLAPTVVRRGGSGRVARVIAAIRAALLKVRTGLAVFRDPRRGPIAALLQLGAWGLQLLACYALFTALGLDGRVGIGAAAAVLFAVNVTAVIPATPSNIGVFQLATISVLTTGFGVSTADALAYGVILQAVEIATAVACGLPALVREGVTWQDMRLRALSAAPVRLRPAGAAENG